MMLNTEKAFQLYELLHKHIPEDADNDLEFIGTIVGNIRFSDTPEDFGEALILMYDLDIDDLQEMSGEEAAARFMDGLDKNKFLSLTEFFQWLTK